MEADIKLHRDEYLRILESLMNKILLEEEIQIGTAMENNVDYSSISWDWYDDEKTIELLYNGRFYLHLSTWNNEGIKISQSIMIKGDDLAAIPQGLKNLMQDVYSSKRGMVFKTNMLLNK
jgi:hypothetical protein